MRGKLFSLVALVTILTLLVGCDTGAAPTATAVPPAPTNTTAPPAATNTTAPPAATDTTAPAAATNTTAPAVTATTATTNTAVITDNSYAAADCSYGGLMKSNQ